MSGDGYDSDGLPVLPEMWQKPEGRSFPHPARFADRDPRIIIRDDAVTNRDVDEEWDDYDTVFYNQWLKIDFTTNRSVDVEYLRKLEIWEPLKELMTRLGMGILAQISHPLYPDMVRQFISSCRVEFDHANMNANQGILSYKIDGAFYSMTIAELCDVYEFERRGGSQMTLPRSFSDREEFWTLIASPGYDGQQSKQSSIRHPVLRLFARLLSDTVLNKPDPGRIYPQELSLLYFAVGDAVSYEDSQREWDYNMGYIWATYLEGLKTRAFAGPTTRRTTSDAKKKNKETFGNLLTPIFQYHSVPIREHSVLKFDGPHINRDFLAKAKMFPSPTRYHFHLTPGVLRSVHWPDPELARIDTSAALAFRPDPNRCGTVGRQPPPPPGPDGDTGAPRDTTQRSRRSSAERRPTPEQTQPRRHSSAAPDEFWAPFYPPPQPTVPASTAEFQEYTLRYHRRQMGVFRRIWEKISGCTRPQSPLSPTARHSPRAMDIDRDQSADYETSRPTAEGVRQSTDCPDSRPTGEQDTQQEPPFEMPPEYGSMMGRVTAPDFYIGTSSQGTSLAFDQLHRKRQRSPQDPE